MAELESMFPIYFARAKQDGETDEDYNTAIAQNENLCNQNFKILFDALADIQATVTGLKSNS